MADSRATSVEILETWRRSQRQHALFSIVVSGLSACIGLYFVFTGVFIFGVPVLMVAVGLSLVARWWWHKFAPSQGVAFNSKTT